MPDYVRAHGLMPAMGKLEPPSRKVEGYHIEFCRARRPAVSWQHLGRMLNRNPEDLRLAVEGPPKLREFAGVVERSAEHRALKAIAAGSYTSAEAATDLDIEQLDATRLFRTLRKAGLIEWLRGFGSGMNALTRDGANCLAALEAPR